MLSTLNLKKDILDLVNSRYDIEVFKDEDLQLTDDTNLCLLIKDTDFNFQEFKEYILPLNVKVIKYDKMIIFNLI